QPFSSEFQYFVLTSRQSLDVSKPCAVSVLQVRAGGPVFPALNRKSLCLRFLRMGFGICRFS
ncbi:hypothetical protein, partial [Roseibium denhamense]|uniref:hypothetical protein n=1 Tax=Roseibium denhamense TaxID=76305 RepID=UPI001AD9351E